MTVEYERYRTHTYHYHKDVKIAGMIYRGDTHLRASGIITNIGSRGFHSIAVKLDKVEAIKKTQTLGKRRRPNEEDFF